VSKNHFAKYLLLLAALCPWVATGHAQTVTPTYQNFVPPAGFAVDAGEPSIGADWNSGKVIFQAGLETDRVTISGSPAAATWEKASPTTSAASLDPIMFTDSTTGRIFVSQLAGACSLSSFSDNDGTSYTPIAGCGVPAGIDHQTIGGGPFAPSVVPRLPPPVGYQHAIYYCSQDIVDASCAVSLNGGLSFGVAVPIYSLLDCGGLHGHIKVGPDGTAYVPNKNCGGGNGIAAVVSSGDNGLTWTVHVIPGSSSGDSDPSVAIASDNTVYFGWHGANGHPMAAVSHDHGATWANMSDVGASLGIQNVAFPAMVAGDGNRAALAFLGTPTGGNAQDTAGFTGVWHLYIAHTYDGGATWTLADATPNDPVQRGSICLGGTACGNDRNLLDFIDVTVDKQGRVLVGYADGCIGPCVNAAPNSFTALGAIARQSTGKGLFAAFDGTF
jgi:hypothetical protein